MAEYTENFNLKKPFDDEFYDINDFNENFEKIDRMAVKKGEGIGELTGGTLATRPEPSIAGKYYFAQDTGEIYYDTGAEWVLAAASQKEFKSNLAEIASNLEFYDDYTRATKPIDERFPSTLIGSQSEFDTFINSVSTNMQDNTKYKRVVSLAVIVNPLGGGRWLLEGFKRTNLYEYQTFYADSSNIYRRGKFNGDWGPWYKIITDAPVPWINATLQNGWTYHTVVPGFYKDQLGIVRLRGLLVDGVTNLNTVLFNLPVGYRPSAQMYFSSYTNASGNPQAQPLAVRPSGDVVIIDRGSLRFIALDGISFKPD